MHLVRVESGAGHTHTHVVVGQRVDCCRGGEGVVVRRRRRFVGRDLPADVGHHRQGYRTHLRVVLAVADRGRHQRVNRALGVRGLVEVRVTRTAIPRRRRVELGPLPGGSNGRRSSEEDGAVGQLGLQGRRAVGIAEHRVAPGRRRHLVPVELQRVRVRSGRIAPIAEAVVDLEAAEEVPGHGRSRAARR